MDRTEIAHRIRELGDDLPRLPGAVTNLLQLMNNDDSARKDAEVLYAAMS